LILVRLLLPLPLLLLLLPTTTYFLSGCSTPTRAKVISRESSVAQPKKRHTGSRPDRYRVKKGDTLYSIAWRYGLDGRSLATWNRIRSPYIIYPGQTLRLSKPPSASRTRQKSANGEAAGSTTRSTAKPKSGQTDKRSAPKTKTSYKIKTRRIAVTDNRKLRWQWPTKGKLKQRYIKGDPARKGIEIGGRSGQPVVAAEAGKVVYAGSGLIGYGRLIIVKHNKNYLSAYGHNRKLHVKEGISVKKGQTLAERGKNGSGETILHFEIRRNGTPVNPLKLLP